jgi:transposase IS66-like protein
MRPPLPAPDSGHYEVASDEGGRRAATLYSLIETAKLNGVNPQAHLTDVPTKLVYNRPNSRLAELSLGAGLPHADPRRR